MNPKSNEAVLHDLLRNEDLRKRESSVLNRTKEELGLKRSDPLEKAANSSSTMINNFEKLKQQVLARKNKPSHDLPTDLVGVDNKERIVDPIERAEASGAILSASSSHTTSNEKTKQEPFKPLDAWKQVDTSTEKTESQPLQHSGKFLLSCVCMYICM